MGQTKTADTGGYNLNNKWRMHYDSSTGEFGPQIRLTNKTGGNTTKGYLVSFSNTTAHAFKYCIVDEPDIIGVVYEAGIADGSECWIWITNAYCQVYYISDVDLEDFARNTITGDSDTTSGKAVAEAAPSPPFSSDKHFEEIGHVGESRTGAGLVLTLLHFN